MKSFRIKCELSSVLVVIVAALLSEVIDDRRKRATLVRLRYIPTVTPATR
jgi:hypothetical protein